MAGINADGSYTGPSQNDLGYESSLSSWAGPYVTDMLGRGHAAADMPYTGYTGPLTAGSIGLQNQAYQGIGSLIGPEGQVTGGYDVGDYTSPYASALDDDPYAPSDEYSQVNFGDAAAGNIDADRSTYSYEGYANDPNNSYLDKTFAETRGDISTPTSNYEYSAYATDPNNKFNQERYSSAMYGGPNSFTDTGQYNIAEQTGADQGYGYNPMTGNAYQGDQENLGMRRDADGSGDVTPDEWAQYQMREGAAGEGGLWQSRDAQTQQNIYDTLSRGMQDPRLTEQQRSDIRSQRDKTWAGSPSGRPTMEGNVAEQYMNPYLQQALRPQLEELRRQSGISGLMNNKQLTQAGAFGGSRQAIMDSELDRNLLSQIDRTQGQGFRDAYDRGMQQFNTEQDRAIRQSNIEQDRMRDQFNREEERRRGQYNIVEDRDYSQYSDAADRAMRAAQQNNQRDLDVINRAAQLGAEQRGIASEGIAADYAQFKEERDYPHRSASYMQSLLQGLPIETQNRQYSDVNALSQGIAGAVGAGEQASDIWTVLKGLFTSAPKPK